MCADFPFMPLFDFLDFFFIKLERRMEVIIQFYHKEERNPKKRKEDKTDKSQESQE
jgi:hypothetical protein